MPNWMKSVTSTPHNPDVAANAMLELEIGEHSRPPPEPGVEEHGGHPGEEECPPDPIAGDATCADDVGDEVRRVGAERRRDHRHADEPPRGRPPGREEL